MNYEQVLRSVSDLLFNKHKDKKRCARCSSRASRTRSMVRSASRIFFCGIGAFCTHFLGLSEDARITGGLSKRSRQCLLLSGLGNHTWTQGGMWTRLFIDKSDSCCTTRCNHVCLPMNRSWIYAAHTSCPQRLSCSNIWCCTRTYVRSCVREYMSTCT